MKKAIKWLVFGVGRLVVAFLAFVIFAIVGPKPAVVEGRDRPA